LSNPKGWKNREIEILQLLGRGLTNQEIGQHLHLAVDTIRWYNKKIYEKLDVNNRTQAVQESISKGLISGQPIIQPTPENRQNSMIARSPIQYISNGDVHIAYMTVGTRPVDLLFIHGFLSHLEVAWEEPLFAQFFETLAISARVILFDKRGMGLSDRVQGAPSLENTIDDALTVLDAVGSRETYVMGTSEGAAAAVLLAATYPERVSGLVLYAATPKVVRSNGGPDWAVSQESFSGFINGLKDQWGQAWGLNSFAPSLSNNEKFQAWWSKILRAASSPAAIGAVLEMVAKIDIRSLLPQVKVRTLIIHKTQDRMVNIGAGRYLAEQMPDAQMVELPGEDHIYFIKSDAILAATRRFIEEPGSGFDVESWIAILLNITPRQGRGLNKDLELLINNYSPRHILEVENSILVIFESPSRAMACARLVMNSPHSGTMKLNLHIGECSLFDGYPKTSVLEQSMAAINASQDGELTITETLQNILGSS
jgi:pimeloyl-ACP methyl ester carboxylesterase/DNA-binding CsgD family transcriptional regulator